MCNTGSSLDKVMICIFIYLCPVAENVERLPHTNYSPSFLLEVIG
jgi:hypothetical protein